MTKATTFEKTLQELEQIVSFLEKGDLSLDDALKQFEKGMHLAKICEEKLTTAEQKIEILSTKSNENELNNE